MLAALGLPAKVLITAIASVATTGSVATGLVSAVGLAPAVAADGREGGSVAAVFVDGEGLSAQSRTLTPGQAAYRYVRVSNDGPDVERAAVTVSGTGDWAAHPGLVVTVEGCTAGWNQAAHRCSAEALARTGGARWDVSTSPSSALGPRPSATCVLGSRSIELQVVVEISPTAEAGRIGAFTLTATATGIV